MYVRLEAAEKFTRRAADAGDGSRGVPLALEEVLHGGDRLRDLAEIELRQAHRAREGVRTAVDGGLEGQLAAAAERALREPAGELGQAQAFVLGVRAQDDVLGLDAVGLGGADGEFERAGVAGPEGRPVRRGGGRRSFGHGLLRLRKQREHVVDVDVVDGDLGLPVGLRPRRALREGELTGAGIRGLQAEAALGVESVGLGRVTSRDRRLRDAAFALA